MQSQLSVGDEVMLSSGFFGTVVGFPEDSDGRVQLELSEGVEVSVARGAITEVLTRSDDSDEEFESESEPEYADDQDETTPNASDRPNPPSES